MTIESVLDIFHINCLVVSSDATPTSTIDPQLLSLAVHEFRTPASVVGGYLRMLQRDTESPLSDRQRKMIDEAEKSCTRLVALIAEMSDLAKLDAGAISLARLPVDVFALAGEVAGHVEEGRDRNVRLALRGAGAGGKLQGDATRLRAAFDAIFRAILREKGGPCTVVADRRRETRGGRTSSIFVVADETSIGTVYDAPRGVFDEKRGGLGLALPLARRVIQGHGGRVWSPADQALGRQSIIVSLPL